MILGEGYLGCRGGATLPWLWRVGRLLVEGMTSKDGEPGLLSIRAINPARALAAPVKTDAKFLAFFGKEEPGGL